MVQAPKRRPRLSATGEKYLQHQRDLRDAAGRPACTRGLPYSPPVLAKPRMLRRRAGFLVRVPLDTALPGCVCSMVTLTHVAQRVRLL